jgi:arabinofuranosyltransferase
VQATPAAAPAREAPDPPDGHDEHDGQDQREEHEGRAERDEGRFAPGRVVQWFLLVLPAAWIAGAGWRYRWITEDGFIYLRIVEQLSSGNGPVFNAGERVEAYTGPAWVAVLGVAEALLPIRAEWLAVGIGLACTSVGVFLATAGARRLWLPAARDRTFVPLGAVVFVAIFPTWGWATGGLETGLAFLWLGACTWVLARWAATADPRLAWWRLVLIGSGWVVRPELVLASLALLVVVTAAQQDARGRLRAIAIGLALPFAYQLFRMAYFGSVVANTAIAKEGSDPLPERGWRYFLDFAQPYWLWVPALALVFAGVPLVSGALASGARRRGAIALALVGAGLLNATYVILVGGDYHHARMFLPALFACCAPFAAVPLSRSSAVAVAVTVVWAVAAVLTLRPDQLAGDDNWLANGFVAQDPNAVGRVTLDDFDWGPGDPNLAWYTGDGYYHQNPLGFVVAVPDVPTDPDGPDALASLWGVGMAGYAPGIELHVLDQMGLADTIAAHLEITADDRRYPGHEKPLPAPWVAALVTAPGSRPVPEHFPNFGTPLIPPTTGAEFDEQVAWARAALQCDELVELQRAATGSLGPGRLVDNLLGSLPNTFLRIPPDPEAAYHRFCGEGVPPEVEELRSSTPPP